MKTKVKDYPMTRGLDAAQVLPSRPMIAPWRKPFPTNSLSTQSCQLRSKEIEKRPNLIEENKLISWFKEKFLQLLDKIFPTCHDG